MEKPGIARAFPPPLLAEIRQRFAHVDRDPHNGQRIFFENAGGSLPLRAALAAGAEVAALPDNIGRQTRTSAHLAGVLENGLVGAALFLDAQEGVVFGGGSNTGNSFRIIGGVAAARQGTDNGY